MQSDVTNQITFGSEGAALAAFRRMVRDMQMEGQPLGSFDFNKLRPMPGELDIEAGARTERGLRLVREYHQALAGLERQRPALSPEDYGEAVRKCEELHRKQQLSDPAAWVLGERAYRNIRQFGSPTWYEWRWRSWGTKWNAYQPRPLGEKDHTMVFLTAWNSVPKIMALLSGRYPEQTVIYRWADEYIGHNVGVMTLKGGEVVEARVPEGGSREAYEMAARIMDIDLSDYDLHLTADGRSYEYGHTIEDPDEDPAPISDKFDRDPPLTPAEQTKEPRKKRGAKGQDR